MPRKCAGTLDGRVCVFGEGNNAPASPASGSRCSLCKPPEEFQALSSAARAAVTRTIKNLRGDQQTAAFKRLEEVPDLLQHVREAIAKELCEVSAKASSAVGTIPPAMSTEELQPAKRHVRIMNQGQFGLCSQFALATCAAQAIQVKYGLWVSDETLLDIWHSQALPTKRMWPVDCANFIGDFHFRCATAFHRPRLKLHIMLDTWAKFCTCVTAFAGFRCVIVVAYMDESFSSTHSMGAVRVNQHNSSATCQNSWGPDDKPLLQICQRKFVNAWAVEPCIFESVVPTEAGKQLKIATPNPEDVWVKLASCF